VLHGGSDEALPGYVFSMRCNVFMLCELFLCYDMFYVLDSVIYICKRY
jgi:hypothetical protein